MKRILALITILCSVPAFAEPQYWMRQDDPDRLGLYLSVSKDCPISRSELLSRVEGEFLRARITPTDSLLLNLTVSVLCLEATTRGGTSIGHAVAYEIRFGTQTPAGSNVLYETPNYGSMLVGNSDAKQFFVDAIRDDVSVALTAYLKANVD